MDGMNVKDYDYDLPEELIAQDPLEDRSSSRLMVLDRQTGRWNTSILRIFWNICIREIAW